MTPAQQTARKYDFQNHSNPAYVKAYRAKIESQQKAEREKETLKSWMFQ